MLKTNCFFPLPTSLTRGLPAPGPLPSTGLDSDNKFSLLAGAPSYRLGWGVFIPQGGVLRISVCMVITVDYKGITKDR